MLLLSEEGGGEEEREGAVEREWERGGGGGNEKEGKIGEVERNTVTPEEQAPAPEDVATQETSTEDIHKYTHT